MWSRYVQVSSRVLKAPVSSSNLRNFFTSRFPLMASAEFEKAKDLVNTFQDDPGNDAKLKMYGLFKQATVGNCNAPKPGMTDFVGKAKWNAWNSLGEMSKDQAEKEYINLVNNLSKELGGSSAPSSGGGDSASASKYDGILLTKENGVTTIKLNRPNKKNAITPEMYKGITEILKEAAEDPKCNLVLVTGTGDYFCSGNDLSNFGKLASMGDINKIANDSAVMLERFVASFIDFPKPLVGAINGHAVGISVTTLALYDLVYTSDKATFHAPFSQLGQSPEACSSYLFPKIMGPSKANELLLINKKITAQEAKERNLVSEIIPHNKFEEEIAKKVKYMVSLPVKSLIYAKKLTRDQDRKVLHVVNKEECERLVERWQSEDCIKALMAFFQRKSNL